jgi:hypothetical protein
VRGSPHPPGVSGVGYLLELPHTSERRLPAGRSEKCTVPRRQFNSSSRHCARVVASGITADQAGTRSRAMSHRHAGADGFISGASRNDGRWGCAGIWALHPCTTRGWPRPVRSFRGRRLQALNAWQQPISPSGCARQARMESVGGDEVKLGVTPTSWPSGHDSGPSGLPI